MDAAGLGDWRARVTPDGRARVVNKIMDIVERHFPIYVQECSHEHRIIAMRFEERIFTTAVSQTDYLRKIALKMLTVESTPQNTVDVDKNAPEEWILKSDTFQPIAKRV